MRKMHHAIGFVTGSRT